MIDILPAILAANEEEFLKQVEHVRALGLMLHIDVMDGNFVQNVTWAIPEKMHTLLEGIRYEVHLMVSNPEHLVPVWMQAGADRVIFHAESTERTKLICHAVDSKCDRLCIAINPETPVSHVMSHLDYLGQVLVMGVTPGKGGQQFDEIALHKVRALKEVRPALVVGVDGGVKHHNAAALAEAGANFLVMGSALTGADDPNLALAQVRLVLPADSTPPPSEPALAPAPPPVAEAPAEPAPPVIPDDIYKPKH